jgi:hypothetical protein
MSSSGIFIKSVYNNPATHTIKKRAGQEVKYRLNHLCLPEEFKKKLLPFIDYSPLDSFSSPSSSSSSKSSYSSSGDEDDDDDDEKIMREWRR